MPSSVPADLPEPLAVVCHDAGACNLIAAWMKDDARAMRVCAEGPAAGIWKRTFPGATLLALEPALEGTAALISGTGWGSDLEHRARVLARRLSIRSIAVLDHWTHYRERFVRAGTEVLPDEIWVADEDARTQAARCLPGIPVVELRNRYLDSLVEEVALYNPQPPRQQPRTILYVLEPIRRSWGHDDRPGELQAFEFLLDHLKARRWDRGVRIALRPHPSDPPGKYRAWIKRFPGIDLSIDCDEPLASQIARADWVAGCETFALVIALRARRIVLSTLPPWAPPCSLPQRELLHLRDLHPASA